MKIWVDADACPIPIKEILYRAADKRNIETVFVANTPLQLKRSEYIAMLQVDKGFDVADQTIVALLQQDDLVITSDIPLAAEVIAKGGLALSVRGELFSPDTIKARLSMRDLMDELRQSGVHSGGQAAFNHTDRQAFANQLDKILTRFSKIKQNILNLNPQTPQD